MLNWTQSFSIFLFLDSNNYQSQPGRYRWLLGADTVYQIKGQDILTEIYQDHSQSKDWLFGHFSYELRTELEPGLPSQKPPVQQNPSSFFCPRFVLWLDTEYILTIESAAGSAASIYELISATTEPEVKPLPSVKFRPLVSKPEYQQAVEAIRMHIKEGDCYELNYCAGGSAVTRDLQPLQAFLTLNSLSPAPYAALYRQDALHLLCASPERYLYKSANQLVSQPIKGTARRAADAGEDEQRRTALQQSVKDRAENVMIVDLVRNDLARSSKVGSVHVEELFGIYSFPQVHQMISTVCSTIREDLPFTDSIRYSFPMGSMTGAPKIKVMELIDKYEVCSRDLFSGSVGYINPAGDFDFNVIIRSLFYNKSTGLLYYQTGGAITYDSDPEEEYEEMRLKAWALERIFE